MKRTLFWTALVMVFTSSLLFAQERMIVMPIAAKKSDEKKVAEAVFENFSLLLSSIKNVKAVSYEKELSTKDAARCKDDLTCMLKVAKEAEADYYLLSKITKEAITIYLTSGAGKKLGSDSMDYERDADEEDIAAKLLATVNKLVSKNVKDSSSSDDSSSSRKSSKSTSKTYSYSDVKEEIKKGMELYKKGDLSGAEETFYRAANEMNCKCSQNEDAKRHYENVVNIKKGIAAAEDASSARDYAKAERVLKAILELDTRVRDAGYKLMVFKKDAVQRTVYRKPNEDDITAVDSIHNQFKRKIEEARKWRLEKQAAIDKWINDRIKDREIKMAERDKKLQEFLAMEKEAKKGVEEKIQGLKYQWEKDDSTLEQDIVKMESQITMIEQKEKGVIKTTNKAREDAQQKEVDAIEKKYGDLRKKLQEEKDAYYKKEKDWEDAEGKKVTDKISEIEKRRKEKEDQSKAENDKLQQMMDEFDKAERAKLSELEAVRMKNEDEDRKYAVEVEKDYQKKFDQLNSQLGKYDQEESKRQADLVKFDKEIEEFMAKSAEKMGKFQEDIEKERSAVEAKYNTDKAQAQQKADQAYQAKQNELTKKKQQLDAAVAKHGDETEQMRAKKEDELTKGQEAKLQALEKQIAKAEEDLARLDQEYETKILQIQGSIAKTTEAEEAEKNAKENDLRQKNESALQNAASFDEKIDREKAALEDIKARMDDDYAQKIAKIEDAAIIERNKLAEALENLKANWGDIVNKEIEKLMAQESALISDLDQKKARLAEIDAKYDARKAEEVNKIEEKQGSLENKYAERLAKVEDQVQKEAEAERARMQADLDKQSQEGASREETFGKELGKLGQEESTIARGFDEQIEKLNQNLAVVDEKYAKQMQPYNVDALVDQMNQEIAELDNKKVEDINKIQELLDAIRVAKTNETQSFQDRKAELKNNKAELSKAEREHQAAMRKIEMDEGSLERKLKFTEESANRTIQMKKSGYERQIAQNKEKIEKFEAEKAKETLDSRKKIRAIEGDKDKALKAHQKKVAETIKAQKSETARREKAVKAGAAEIERKVNAILKSVKQRQAAVLAEKAAETKALKEQKAAVVGKVENEAKGEKGKISGEISAINAKIAATRKEIKGWEKRSAKVDKGKLEETRKPFAERLAALDGQKKALLADKAAKMKGVAAAASQKMDELQKQKGAAAAQTKGFDGTLKVELKKVGEKYAAQKAALQAEVKKLAAEKAEKAAALTKAKTAAAKERDMLEKGFAKNIKKDIAALESDRAKELKKMSAELAAVTKALEQHEQSKELLMAQAVEAIDGAYEAKMTELDMKNVTENKRLQDENKKFEKEKRAQKAAAEKGHKMFLAEKDRFRKGIDKAIADAQKARDGKMADRQKKRAEEYKRWDEEKGRRKKSFEDRTAGTRQKIAALAKEIEKAQNDVAVANAEWAKKLDETKVRNQAEGQKREKAWRERQEKETAAYEEAKKKIVERYEQIEIKEKGDREKQKQALMVQRDKLLAEKDRRKDKRQGILDKEKGDWEKKQAKMKDNEQKLRDELDLMKTKRESAATQDKEEARKKKEAVENEYQKKLQGISDEELKVVQSRYKEAYKIESKRDLELTGTTRKIEATLAEVWAKSGLDKLNDNELASARDLFVQALYLNRDDKTAKEGLSSINSKAKAIYWEAYGIRDSDKSKARKMLQQLLKSLLATDEYFLKSRNLLEELK